MLRFASLSLAVALGLAAWAGPGLLEPRSARADEPGLLEKLTEPVEEVTAGLPLPIVDPPEVPAEAAAALDVPAPASAEPVQSLLETAPPALTGAVEDTVSPVLAPATETLEALTAPVLEPAAAIVEPAAEAALELAARITEPAFELVGPATGPVFEAVAPIIEPAQPAVGPIVDPATGSLPRWPQQPLPDGSGTPTYLPHPPVPGSTTQETTTQPAEPEASGSEARVFRGPVETGLTLPSGTTAHEEPASPTAVDIEPARIQQPAFRIPDTTGLSGASPSSAVAAGTRTASIAPAPASVTAAPAAPAASAAPFSPSASSLAVISASLALGLALLGTRRISLEWLLPPSRAIAPEVPPA